MYPSIVRHILYPLHERLRGRRTLEFLADFRAGARCNEEERRRSDDDALRRLLRHAAAESPHYADVVRSMGLEASSLDVDDLARFPIIDKETIRGAGERMIASSFEDRVFKLATGGSSGRPLIFWTDKLREASQLAAKLRAREWWDIRIGDVQVDLWGSPIEIGAQDRFRTFKDALLNFHLFSAFRLSDAEMATFSSRLRRIGARFIYGYASVLARYARFLDSRGESLRDLGLKGAISTAEMLFAEQRVVIERAFGCRVINEYGCRDGGFIAQECPSGSLHIASDTVRVEIVDGDRPVAPGTVGDIVLTNLWSYGMPLIRYRIGDRAALSSERCSCGLSLPLLRSIEGRITDTLLTPEGNRIHGLGAMYVIRVLDGVDRFQVVQDAPDHVEVAIVATAAADRSAIDAKITSGLRDLLGKAMRVDVRFVEDIAVLPSGKLRSVWNKLDAP